MLGQAFQIADDLLDVESDAATLGKATGKDEGKGKATLVGLWGVEAARKPPVGAGGGGGKGARRVRRQGGRAAESGALRRRTRN